MSCKNLIFSTSLLLFVILTAGCVSIGISDDEADHMIQNQFNQHIEDPVVTDSEYFSGFEADPNTIVIFGEVPLLEGNAAYYRSESLHSIAKTIQYDDHFTNYLEEHGGPLAGYTTSTEGYMLIYVIPEKKDELKEEDIEKIMKIINQAASDHGIENIPVVFHASRLEVNGIVYRLGS